SLSFFFIFFFGFSFFYCYYFILHFFLFIIFFRLFSFYLSFVFFIKNCVKLNYEIKKDVNHMKMYADERREHIYTYIKSHKRATVKQLSDYLSVTEATVRSD